MASTQCFAAQTSFASWPLLPAEIKAEIVGNLDLATALAMMRCGGVEQDLVRKFGRFHVAIRVSNQTPEQMTVSLEEMDAEEKLETQEVQKWEIRKVSGGSLVRIVNNSGKVIDQKFHPVPMAQMAFSIVGRLMADKMFKVMKLEFALKHYDGPIDFNLKKPIDVDHILVTRCSIFAAQQILDNKMIRTNTWFVSFECRTKLEWAREKLLNIGKEKKLENMGVLRIGSETIMYCPRDIVRSFFKNTKIVTQCGKQF